MRSNSFLSVSFALVALALGGCAVGSEAPNDPTSTQEINGNGDVISIARDGNPELPTAARGPSVGDESRTQVRDLLANAAHSRLDDQLDIQDVTPQRRVGIEVNGGYREPGTAAKRIDAAGEGRSVIHVATGTPLDRHPQIADDPGTLLGVDGDPN